MKTETIYKPLPAFKPLYKAITTFYAYHGGRGGGKSWGIADFTLLAGVQAKHRVLCCREVQKSIKESVHRLLSDRIEALGLSGFYEVLETEIRGKNGTTFSFSGLLQHTVVSIKSFEGATITWIEEAQTISQRSLSILIPTVLRTPNAIVMFSLNPYLPTDPVYAEYIEKQRDDCTVVQINYTDNPHCPELLKIEAEKLRESDPEAYDNIWLGRPKYIADGAVYKNELAKARSDGRITRVPIDPALKVHTVWDLGVSDSTTIWFAQVVGKEVRIVDYYEATGEGLPHYARILEQRGYLYGKHFAPHDIVVRELGSGVSRIETAKKLGINFEIVKNVSVEDGIEASRQILSSCWFDTDKCSAGLHALSNYRREYNDKMGEFKARPVHDWASHAADAFRYLALSVQAMHVTPPPPPPSMPKRTHHWNRR